MIGADYLLDRAFYDRVRSSSLTSRPVSTGLIPPNNGYGFEVMAGQTFRVVLHEAPQVADLLVWNRSDPKERFCAPRTATLEGWFIKVGSRLWSDVPWLRPLATCITDTVVSTDPEFHHHFVGSHCAPEWIELRGGPAGSNACHVNLLQAIEPFGLSEADIPDGNLNLHQKHRIDPTDGVFYGTRSEGSAGDYVEFYAELDLLAAVSVCPNGDNTRYWSEPGDPLYPIRIEVFESGIAPRSFRRWSDWRSNWTGRWVPPAGYESSQGLTPQRAQRAKSP
jgi:uncharacterized protein YcgI (DUF1989 family)